MRLLYTQLKEVGLVSILEAVIEVAEVDIHVASDAVLPSVPETSLYHSDPTRHNPKARIFTKQRDVERVLEMSSLNENLLLPNRGPFENGSHFDWASVAEEAQPTAGKLPEKRVNKKFAQLESVACAVIDVVARINAVSVVDFCSGGGHLGILLAYLLRHDSRVRVGLVENKEESLRRAHRRVAKLGKKD